MGNMNYKIMVLIRGGNMKFSEIFRYEIANKCLWDKDKGEDKYVDIKCDRCNLEEICLQICDELENKKNYKMSIPND